MIARGLNRTAAQAHHVHYICPGPCTIARLSQNKTRLTGVASSKSSNYATFTSIKVSPSAKNSSQVVKGPVRNQTWPPCPPLRPLNPGQERHGILESATTIDLPALEGTDARANEASTSTSSQFTKALDDDSAFDSNPAHKRDAIIAGQSGGKEQSLSGTSIQLNRGVKAASAIQQTRNYSSQPSNRKPSAQQPEESPTNPPGEAKAPQSDESEPVEPTKPLPDLRQGIPSTFGEEYTDFKSAKAQEPESTSLNITEDPDAGSHRSRDEAPKEEYVSSIERRRNALARYMYIAFATFAVTASVYLGQNWATEEEAKQHSDAPNGWTPIAFYARIKARLNNKLGYYTEPMSPTLLPNHDPNFIPPYTLVLSLEDLLVSSKWSRSKGWEVAKRPGVDYFIRYLSQYYEIVLFTSVPSFNGEMVYRKLDPYRLMQPLFREATRYIDGEHVKDLSYLNRDLSKTIIIDTNPKHVRFQPENSIILPKWSGTKGDAHVKDLVALIPLLEFMAGMSVEDVRKILKSYEGSEDIPAEFQRREAAARAAFNEKLKAEKGKKGRLGSGVGGLSSALGLKPIQPRIPGEMTFEEGLAQGKMLSDIIRERGQRHYIQLEQEFREKGDEWLKAFADEEKKMQEESMQSMQKGLFSVFGGGGGGGDDSSNSRNNSDS